MAQANSYKQLNIHLNDPCEDGLFHLYFIGEISSRTSYDIPAHRDGGYEFCYATAGRGIFKVFTEEYPFAGGDLFLACPDDFHAIHPDKADPCQLKYFCLVPAVPCDETRRFTDLLDRHGSGLIPGEWDDLLRIFDVMLHSAIRRPAGYTPAMHRLIDAFLLLACGNLGETNDGERPLKDSIRHNHLVLEVFQYIDSHLSQDFQLEELSDALSYSVPHLCRTFKAVTGFSIREYYNFSRLEKSKHLLRHSDLSVTAIAEQLGFASIHHYSRMFSQIFRLSPSQYRRQTVTLQAANLSAAYERAKNSPFD